MCGNMAYCVALRLMSVIVGRCRMAGLAGELPTIAHLTEIEVKGEVED